MTTKPQLEQRVRELEAQLGEMTARAERAESGVPASALSVVGYWIFDLDHPVDALWDGELHRTLKEAEDVLEAAHAGTPLTYSEKDTRGLAIYEMRPLTPLRPAEEQS